MDIKREIVKKPRGMKYFAYLCTVNAVLGLILSFLFCIETVVLILWYPRLTPVHVLCGIAWGFSFAFYIGRIVCYSRYRAYKVYPRWLFNAMSFSVWYGSGWFAFVSFLVNNGRIKLQPPTLFLGLLVVWSILNQIYLIRRRHLFVFDKTKLVYQAPVCGMASTPQVSREQQIAVPEMPVYAPPASVYTPPAPVQEQDETELESAQEEQEEQE